jgi:hypothetical protein
VAWDVITETASLPGARMGGADSALDKGASFAEGHERLVTACQPTDRKRQLILAVPAGLEPATFGLGNRCSIRLSYGTDPEKCLF